MAKSIGDITNAIKEGFKFGTKGEINRPSDTAGKAIMGGSEMLLEDIETTLATALSNLFFGNKTPIRSFNDYRKFLSKQSPLFTDIAAIRKGIDEIFDTKKNKNFKEIHKFFKDSAIALDKLSDNKFMTELVTKKVVKDSVNDITDKLKVSNSSEKNKEEEKMHISVKGLDAESLKALERLATLKVDNDSMMSQDSISGLSATLDALINVFANKTIDKKLTQNLLNNLKDVKKVFDYVINDLSPNGDKLKEHCEQLVVDFDRLCLVFDAVVATGTRAEAAKAANKKISNTLNDVNQTAVDSSKNSKNAERATIDMNNVGEFIFICGVTLLLGAYIIKIPGLVENALKFGLVLGLFIVAVMAPLALISKLANPTALKEITQVKGFIVTCGLIMTLGAAVMLVPGLVENALKFGVTLGLFIAAVLLPIALYSKISGEASKSLEHLSGLIVACTLIMMVGALFVMIPNAVKNALMFGAVLGLFELMVLAPIMFFNIVCNDAFAGIKGLSSFIVTCTLVMLLGAAFMALGGGKFVAYALAFGLTLALFEALVISPFILFRFIAPEVMKSLKQFTACIVVMTTVLLIGALFMYMGGGKMAVAALAFGLLMATFEALVILPFLIFNFLSPIVMKSLKQFTLCVAVMTIILMVGAYFMMKNGGEYAEAALKFTVLLALFEAGVILPMFLFKKVAADVAPALAEFALFVGVCGAVMIAGPILFKQFGVTYSDVFLFTLNFGLFVGEIGLIFVAIQKLMQIINKGGGLQATAEAAIGVDKNKLSRLNVANELSQFAITVAILAAVMTMGPIIIKTFNISYNKIWEFTKALSTFVSIMSGIFIAIQYLMKKINGNGGLLNGSFIKEILMPGGAKSTTTYKNPLLEFAITVGILAGVMTLGPLLIKLGNISYNDIWTFTGALDAFVVVMGVIFVGITRLAGEKNIASIKEFSMAVGILAAVLVGGPLVMKQFNIKYDEVAVFGFELSVFVGVMGTIFTLISKYMGDAKTMSSIMAFSAAVGVLGAVIVAGPIFMKEYGVTWSEVAIFGTELAAFVAVMGSIFGVMGKFAKEVALGSAVAIAMSVGLSALSVAIAISCTMMKDWPDALNTLQTVALLAGEFAVIFGIIGIPAISAVVALGSAVMLAVSLAMAVFSTAINISCQMLKDWPDALSDLQTVALLAGEFATIFGIIGIPLVSAVVALGSAVLTGVAEAMITFNTAISRLSGTFVKYGGIDKVKTYIDAFKTNAQDLVGVFSSELSGLILKAKIDNAKHNLNAISEALILYGVAIDTLADGIKKIQTVKGFSGDMLYNYSGKIIVDFAKAIPSDMKDYNDKIAIICKFADKVNYTIKKIATAIADMANLKVAQEWDKKGNPIKFRQLRDNDFKLAINNVGLIVTTMATAIKDAHNQLKNLGWTDMAKVLSASKEMGVVIGSIGEGVGKMAQLQIPIEWNEKGKPIAYRTLKSKDFTAAALGVSQVITTLGMGIMQAYQMGATLGNGKNIFDESYDIHGEKQESPFARTISASMKLGELISSTAEGVAKMANLQVPEIGSWDPKEKRFTRYKTLKRSDFKDAANNTSDILNVLGGAIIKTYNDNPKMFDDVVTCTKKGGIFTSDEYSTSPSPMVKAIGASSQLVKLVAEAANSVQKMAALMIPDKWDSKGHAIHYKQLINEDFQKAAKNTETIITTMAAAMKKTYDNNKSLFDNKNLSNIIKHTNEMTGVIGKVADVLIKTAKAQIPDKWDSKGHAIHYSQINIKESSDLMKNNILTIIKSMCTTFKEAANILKQEFGDVYDTKVFSESNSQRTNLSAVIKGVGGMAKVFSNVADTIIKLAKARVPVYIKGKLDHYDPINIPTTVKEMKTNFKDMVKGMIEAITNPEVIKELIELTKDEGKLDTITSSINKIAGTIGKVADVISKLSAMKIATGFSKDGKALGYKTLFDGGFETVKTQLNSFLMGNNNIFKLLVDPIKELNTEAYKLLWDKNEVEKFEQISNNINNVVGIIGSTVKQIVELANGKVATGYNKDGKPTGYEAFMENGFSDVKEKLNSFLGQNDDNIFKILCNSADALVNLVQGKDISDINNAETYINNIIDIIGSTLLDIKPITDDKELIASIYDYKSKMPTIAASVKTGIDLFDDIINIITSVKTVGENLIYTDDISKNVMLTQMNYMLLTTMIISLMQSLSLVNTAYMNFQDDLIQLSQQLKPLEINTGVDKLLEVKQKLVNSLTSVKNITLDEQLVREFVKEIKTTESTLQTVFSSINSIATLYNSSKSLLNDVDVESMFKQNIDVINRIIADIDDFIKECAFTNKANVEKIDAIANTFTSFKHLVADENGIADNIVKVKLAVDMLGFILKEPEDKKAKGYLTKIIVPIMKDIDTMIEALSETQKQMLGYDSVPKYLNDTGKSLSVLGDGINAVMQAIYNAKSNKMFNTNVLQLNKFIKSTINEIDIERIDRLTNLVLALNTLAEKTTNLDELTNAIANNLTDVLQLLAEKMDEAKGTFNTIEKIQKSRHELINRSVDKIKEIMANQIEVHVTADTPNANTENGQAISQGEDTQNDGIQTTNTQASALSSGGGSNTVGTSSGNTTVGTSTSGSGNSGGTLHQSSNSGNNNSGGSLSSSKLNNIEQTVNKIWQKVK